MTTLGSWTVHENWSCYSGLCFVTFGVSLNMSSHGVVMGFPAILLPQLMQPDSPIPIDSFSGSWIASVTGFTLIVGNIILPAFMGRFGRRNANLTSIVVMIIGWVVIIIASSVAWLIVARLLQGLALGMTASLGSVLIGEYTSPANRGAFLATISLSFTIGVLIVHTVGKFVTWRMTALIFTIIKSVNFMIVICSPESPSWLIDKKRYSDGEKVFRWLRGHGEEDELKKIISSKMAEQKQSEDHKTITQRFKDQISYLIETVKKIEFYKPVLIMIHLYALGQWSGANILAAYTDDVYPPIVGYDVAIEPIVISVDVQRIVSNFIAVFIIRRVKRRKILAATAGLNVFAYLVSAGYIYAVNIKVLPSYHYVGIVLVNIHMFSIAMGTVPLPFIIAGELYPLEYRGLASCISVIFMSINLFLTVKTFQFLLSTLELYGAYCLYAFIVFYCFVIAMIFLPETKDRTLKEIEEEMRGNRDRESRVSEVRLA